MHKIKHEKFLLKPSEVAVKESIDPVLVMLGTEYNILSQVALSAFIDPDQLSNSRREWSLCLNSNVDFLTVLGRYQEPLFAAEHDGSIHRTNDKKKENDERLTLPARLAAPSGSHVAIQYGLRRPLPGLPTHT